MGIKIDLDIYDHLAFNMKMPKVVGKTVPLTKLPDDFEPNPNDLEHNESLEEEIARSNTMRSPLKNTEPLKEKRKVKMAVYDKKTGELVDFGVYDSMKEAKKDYKNWDKPRGRRVEYEEE